MIMEAMDSPQKALVFKILQKNCSPNLQHNNSIIMDVKNEERALPYKEDWMIKFKRKKYLIKGGERMIHVK